VYWPGRYKGRQPTGAGSSCLDGQGFGQLKDAIVGLDGPFTIRDVSKRIGGSLVTVKNALADLEREGKIRPSADKKAGSRGQAAKTWTVSAA
jgi:predicted ArsR family transcriptional regulator